MKIYVLWIVLLYGIARVLETFWTRKKIKGKIIAAYTLHLLIACHAAVFLATVWDWALGNERQNLTWQFYLGVLLILIATVGRNWSIRTLGVYHSIQIEIRSNHPLITDGPYRYLRNPYYLSNALEVVGLPLMANSQLGVILAIALYWPALALRIVLEEGALQQAIKGSFSEYKLKTPRLLPRLGEVT
jgi:protein-S-isoprenylcysteine O-methyltransferase Ste14